MADVLGNKTEDGWSLFEVGKTSLNDTAIVEAGKHFAFLLYLQITSLLLDKI